VCTHTREINVHIVVLFHHLQKRIGGDEMDSVIEKKERKTGRNKGGKRTSVLNRGSHYTNKQRNDKMRNQVTA
jgi:hypothetical protein